MDNKKCSKCKLFKSVSDFSKNSKERSGYASSCKDCYHLLYRSKHPSKLPPVESLENEEWLPVVGYEGLYEVSNMGRVKSIERDMITISNKRYRRPGKIIKLHPDCKRGYLIMQLHKKGVAVSYSIHRLVALAFIPNPDNLPEVNHKWGIKTDNRVTELVWSTSSDNQQHAYDVLNKTRPMLGKFGKDHHTSKPVNQYSLDGKFIKRWDSIADIERSGLTWSTNIIRCLQGKAKQVKKYKWAYA